MLTKARERAVTMCWAAGDEDLQRRWAELAEESMQGVSGFLDPSRKCGIVLRRCSKGQEGPGITEDEGFRRRRDSPVALRKRNPRAAELGAGQKVCGWTPGRTEKLLRRLWWPRRR